MFRNFVPTNPGVVAPAYTGSSCKPMASGRPGKDAWRAAEGGEGARAPRRARARFRGAHYPGGVRAALIAALVLSSAGNGARPARCAAAERESPYTRHEEVQEAGVCAAPLPHPPPSPARRSPLLQPPPPPPFPCPAARCPPLCLTARAGGQRCASSAPTPARGRERLQEATLRGAPAVLTARSWP